MSASVGIAQTRGGIAAAVDDALSAAGLGDAVTPGARVLIKPNLHGGAGYTSMPVIEAVVRWAQDKGASEVIVGAGPYYGHDGSASYFERIGVIELCERLSVSFVNFHDGKYDVVESHSTALPETIGVTHWARWADVVISAPVMKTHFNTLSTLAIKNLKGFIRPRDKREIHQMDLHLAIAALAKLVRPDVNLLDASIAYEGMGPASGTPLDMGLVLAGSSTFSMDVVGNWLMGFEPTDVRYLREAERLGLGRIPQTDDDVADMTGMALNELQRLRRTFRRPYDAAAESYPNLVISTEMACSGCLMNLFTALRDLEGEGIANHLTGTVAIGKPPPDADLAIGKCTSAAWEYAQELSGCPPGIEEIKELLRRMATSEGKP